MASCIADPSINAQLQEPCVSLNCPAAWRIDPWTPCTSSCGNGEQSRVVVCEQDLATGPIAVPESRCTPPKPAQRRACKIRSCPSKWAIGAWSPCTRTCGSGEQVRSVQCIGLSDALTNETRDEKTCPVPKPRTQQYCSFEQCPPFWEVYDFPPCYEDGATVTRPVHCKVITADGVVSFAQDSLCYRDAGPKPVQQQKCSPYCNRAKGEYDWFSGDWRLVSFVVFVLPRVGFGVQLIKFRYSLGEWPCALRRGVQHSMEAILACHPALSTK